MSSALTALTVSDLTVVSAEPRVRDLDLAERLGFERPRKIRELIRRNMNELLRYGGISPYRGAKIGRGRPEQGFLLNEAQALLICVYSDTERAADVREQVISVYLAWRRGELERDLPDPRANEIDSLRKHHNDTAERWRAESERRQAALDTFDQARSVGAKVSDAARLAAEQASVCTSTIYSWRASVRMVQSCDRPAALTPQYRGGAAPQECHPEAWATLTRLLRTKRYRGFSDCYRRMRATADQNGWSPILSERSLRRRVNALLSAQTRVKP
ncbi:MAG: DNA-binding domain-containing protein [Rhizobiaceae bacterium]|nr:DNA-binding domain-containing protein [Rhizobiaceae bacterium]